jgi:hypothetical protein
MIKISEKPISTTKVFTFEIELDQVYIGIVSVKRSVEKPELECEVEDIVNEYGDKLEWSESTTNLIAQTIEKHIKKNGVNE